MVTRVKFCIGTALEGVDCLQMKTIRAKCIKYKESVSLEKVKHVETYEVHVDAKKIKVMSNVS